MLTTSLNILGQPFCVRFTVRVIREEPFDYRTVVGAIWRDIAGPTQPPIDAGPRQHELYAERRAEWEAQSAELYLPDWLRRDIGLWLDQDPQAAALIAESLNG